MTKPKDPKNPQGKSQAGKAGKKRSPWGKYNPDWIKGKKP